MPGNSASAGFVENQFNDNTWLWGALKGSTINTPFSYMWIKSDRYGAVNWGLLSQATDNVGLLPDLSGTVIESNAVMFDGAGMFVRPKGAKNASDIATGDFTWGSVLTCLGVSGGIAADCNGYPETGVRYDTPTWAGFSASGGWYEDDVWDIAVKYSADWNSVKVSAAFGFAQITDEGCGFSGTSCTNLPFLGGGGAPFQGYRKDAGVLQVGVSVLHVPSGLWVYGYYEHEDNNGTQFQTLNFNTGALVNDSNANSTDAWFAKAGIRRTWTNLGATVIWGEGGQYFDMFGNGQGFCPGLVCISAVPSGQTTTNGVNINNTVAVTGSTVNRWGAGIVQEIDAAAMHLFFRWQHLNVGLNERCADPVVGCLSGDRIVQVGSKVSDRFDDLDIFQAGGLIFF
jgi:hypothetical protein